MISFRIDWDRRIGAFSTIRNINVIETEEVTTLRREWTFPVQRGKSGSPTGLYSTFAYSTKREMLLNHRIKNFIPDHYKRLLAENEGVQMINLSK